MKLNIVREMMAQRKFDEYKIRDTFMIGSRLKDDKLEFIYIKIFNTKFELNVVREFLWSKFTIDGSGNIFTKNTNKNVVQLIIICKSFQNSHIKEFKEVSNHIQLIREDFFNINITKKAPYHEKVTEETIVNKKEIPIIKENDPNCIFYNFVKGDIIRVVRSDGDICYRLVR
ncbi:RNA polymerase II subunit Rpb5b [Invertebrate iridescent virus 22]|uniref:RNA polymerase II subunit Rpb5b n=1 Tax=Invertebrate iridescent virus 22 TaxID=345198 RepID=S6DDP9_9VIRU|nr:RNA polymerase II subunit Rpb5b [Invertebrate iridescent virus 22]CCV01709.1 RNA polymerase II subunit Rpb5b [Invertebrate iridescent virus 22]